MSTKLFDSTVIREAQEAMEFMANVLESSTEYPIARVKRATILVVDDSLVNVELARGILEPVGYELVAANSVAEAQLLLGEIDPDLIFSDVHMKGETGFDFLKSLKADQEFKAIPLYSYRQRSGRNEIVYTVSSWEQAGSSCVPRIPKWCWQR